MTWLMDEADVCRTSSRASRRPLDVISTVAILDPRWRGRKWRHPGPGAVLSSPIVAVAQDGGPSASGRHLGWPHLREPEMRSSKNATGSGRAAILRHRHNGARKNLPILLAEFPDNITIYFWYRFSAFSIYREFNSNGVIPYLLVKCSIYIVLDFHSNLWLYSSSSNKYQW